MKRPGIRIVLAGILMTLFFASTVLAAYEFYMVQLTSKSPIDWALVAKKIGAVKGVERTQIDKEKGVVTVTCSSQCDDSILNGVKNKLKAKGIEQTIVTKPTLSSTAGQLKIIKIDKNISKTNRVGTGKPVSEGKVLPQNK
ncbi:MAG: hypothetical protein C0399_03980 [Syntrophus sp. (in: bacteria)]|nr:hypothetical protein [Syntrophus sp. (in: bacteria)]